MNFRDNPIIYHILTDRFAAVPGVAACAQGELHDNTVGTFHGGTFVGITRKLREGWFTALGVNALLISAPYRQIIGWVPGADGQFRHYGYHGYYALDYTVTEARFGSPADFAELVATAHACGLKVLLDIVMNHPGYPDLETLATLQIDALADGWQAATPADYYAYLDRDSPALADWWGRDWVRAELAGYAPGGDDDHSALLFGLPDFKTEQAETVGLPKFFQQLQTEARDLPATTVRGYLVEWLCAWVRQYGIDGFRCDSAKHVEPASWLALKRGAQQALQEWRREQGVVAGEPFWMLAEVFGHGIERSPHFHFGFDSIINFELQQLLHTSTDLEVLYQRYAERVGRAARDGVVSYLSSHDTYLLQQVSPFIDATTLLLAPGGVMILYGEESARTPSSHQLTDATQNARSNMNWRTVNTAAYAHWCKLTQFRSQHAAIAIGSHHMLSRSPYVFVRSLKDKEDWVLVGLHLEQPYTVAVDEFFPDGECLRDAYGGAMLVVADGHVTLPPGDVVLVEKA